MQVYHSMKSSFQIIYLNGPSSSGKTTLAKALQAKLEPPFLHIGLDRVIGMMPEKLNNWEGGIAPEGFSWLESVDETGHLVHEIQMGPYAKKICQTLKEIVLTLARIGHYIIIDDVAFGSAEVHVWKETLKEHKVLWVGIKAPLAILEEREKTRGNRIIGSARAQHFKVHSDVRYDLECNTSKEPLEDIIMAIMEKICQTT